MSLKNILILTSFLIYGFQLISMEQSDIIMVEKLRVASTAEEWRFLYHVSRGVPKDVDEYIAAGGNLDIVDDHGNSPLDIAIQHDNFMGIYSLVSNKTPIKESCLFEAIMSNSSIAARALIELGADVNYYPKNAWGNVLMFAVRYGLDYGKRDLLSLIPLFIEKNVELSTKGSKGYTAYDFAYKYMKRKNEWDHDLLRLLNPQKQIEQCSICLEDLAKGVTATKCNHKFHVECLCEWTKKGRNSCPICRGIL